MEVVSLSAPAHPDQAIRWVESAVLLLDQRVLPRVERYVRCCTASDMADAIRAMVVRGAPAIGIAAAYGVVLAALQHANKTPAERQRAFDRDMAILAASRPTAVNLFWALRRMQALLANQPNIPAEALLAEAKHIHQEDIIANRLMGELGAACIAAPTAVITHCNTGGLATGGHGTALGVIRTAFQRGKITHVYADETRPWLQGSRLTAWELLKESIPSSLMVDGAAAARMRTSEIGWVIVGADRIAANGDVANKIGTYQLAVAARYHGVKFMVVAPTSTLDLSIASGADIPIETRAAEEVLLCGGTAVGAPGADAWNPVFDVTPAELIDVLVTERGVVRNPADKSIRAILS